MIDMKSPTQARNYLLRPQGNCWIGSRTNNGLVKTVTRWSEELVFECEFDGYDCTAPPNAQPFTTKDVDAALRWLYEDKWPKYDRYNNPYYI